MRDLIASQAPPFCPNPGCEFHGSQAHRWRYVRTGTFARQCPPRIIQRYRCSHCGRHFSDQTFRTTYWLKRPDLLRPVFFRLLACSGFRQIAREFEVSPTTILTHSARLGRHCLLVHQQLRPRSPLAEPLALDSFISFEYSQYHPTAFHVAAGQHSHFFYGFTASELRRSGRMTRGQRRRRRALEARHGRPHPRSIEHDVADLLAIVAPQPQALELHTDEHHDYPRAVRRAAHLSVTHRTVSSRAARSPRNPLFAINLLDLLIRHNGANHKRQTIAFSKRRQSAVERLAVLLVWRNYLKPFSERRRGATPAMRLGLLERPLEVSQLLARRRFATREPLPQRWASYYRRELVTRRIPRCARLTLKFAA
jgi:transposase-like protein